MLKNKLYLYGNDVEATVPAHLHLGKYMLNKFKSFGDHEAIINAATDERMTFKELTQLTVDIALSLVHIGVKNGDVVSICSENVMEFLPVIYGTFAAGATFSAIDASCGGLSSSHRFNIARPKILFCSPSTYNKNKDIITSMAFIGKIIIFGEPIEEAIGFKEFLTQHANVDDFDTAPVNPLEDDAIILFTSGTSGMPKGIRMTHYKYLIVLQNWYSEIYTGMRSLPVVDWYLNYGQYLSFFLHQMGLALVYYNNADTEKILEIVQDYKVTLVLE
ncbi:unnamed protein product [Euphydryas editha]|uniref:AMP-dependent synthetase/ligase domain-containing protein n=2 Tax=Euphydryas editha TaxID=104508 RepID=A0AAU9URT6_EUPED|nr:unnamed protein product [Euphydryas editha]